MADSKQIELSSYTNALIESYFSIKPKKNPDDLSRIYVSQTVSFLALVYERLRNAIEYREDHLIRRAAIERILRRRLALNPDGRDEAENIVRELLWARYFPNGSLGASDLVVIQDVLDKLLYVKSQIMQGRSGEERQLFSEFITHLLTCEIEEVLSPEDSEKNKSYTFFLYQVLRQKIKIENITEKIKDAYFLAALEKAFRRSDIPYQRYHLFITVYKPIHAYSKPELEAMIPYFPQIIDTIEKTIKNSYVDRLVRFAKKQLPPFLILFELIQRKKHDIKTVLTNTDSLWIEVDKICREKYQMLHSKVRTLAIRSFIYIFLTKMIFALILEFPLSQFIYNEVSYVSIAINTLFPPFLMLFIISFFKIPGEENTRIINKRIIQIVDKNEEFETNISFIQKTKKGKNPVLIFGFTVFYSLTFLVTLLLIFNALSYLEFNLISQAIFIFFVSIVTFFSYRIKQGVNEYKIVEKESIFTPFVDFFFMPILSLGKIFSGGLSRLNFFIFIFDFIIEAPFKLIFEVVEEWISFVRKRKEEIF